MLKKFLIYLILLIAVFISLLFFLKDYLLKIYIINYVKKNFASSCSIVKVHIWARNICLEGLSLSNKGLALSSQKINITFNLGGSLRPQLSKVVVDNTAVNIKDFSRINNAEAFKASRIMLIKGKHHLYRLNINNLAIASKEFGNISVPLKIKANQVIFPKAKNAFFGPDAYMGGVFFSAGESCLKLKFNDISFANIIAIMAGEDNADVQGLFDGQLTLCTAANQLKEIVAAFKNKKGGLVNIKKETSLDFLKSYLDAPSYKALVDNLKNYEYNIGQVTIASEQGVLAFKINLNSEKMGRRNIVINIHTEDR